MHDCDPLWYLNDQCRRELGVEIPKHRNTTRKSTILVTLRTANIYVILMYNACKQYERKYPVTPCADFIWKMVKLQ
jgi:hypothetical protein